ncbi:MAG: FMN-binding protein [Clostridia bacterium]|nr:FMN-binding protein [Clostridia bacterium]
MDKIMKLIKANLNDIIKPSAVLLAICIVIPLALSLTNAVTRERIAKLAAENEIKTMSALIAADEFELLTCIGSNKNPDFDFYIALKDGKHQGYIFITSAKGYGGEVSVMTAVTPDKKVKAVSILDATNETPGLGQNVTKEGFYSQFSQKSADITLVKNGAESENNEINAVTGATISSRAVTKAVNEALERFDRCVNKSLIPSVKEAETDEQ